MRTAATHHLIRRLNRSAILDLIRERGPISRTAISQELNISLPTIMRIIDDLVASELVRDGGDNEPSGGRPRSLVEFNGAASAVVGIDLGGTKMYGTVASLGGEIQHEVYFPWDNGKKVDSLQKLFDLIDTLIASPRPEGQKIRGIGVGAPGITLSETGVVSWAPSLGWRDLPLRQILLERYALPVIVENDVNLAALGEYGFGVGKGASVLVSMTVGTGIGAGIIIDRKIYRGFHQSAGEIGYLPPDKTYLSRHYEDFGALESIASGTGIARRSRSLLQQMDSHQAPHQGSAEDVFNAARRGESWARQLVDETVNYLSLAIAAIVTLLDPEIIILGGGVAQSADVLIEPILERLEGVVPVMPRLVQSDLGFRATVMGAIMLVLDETTEHISLVQLA